MNAYDQIWPLLPEVYGKQIMNEDILKLEEIRIGSGRPVRLHFHHGERELYPCANKMVVEEVVQRACRRSIYAHLDTISQGYVTIPGGHRMGICGTGVMDEKNVQNIRDISSLNIRIARERIGYADEAFKVLRNSALLLGPPGCGKTTLLRDLIRQLSDFEKYRVGLADERGELSAMAEGLPWLRVGNRTDVLVHIPKGQAMMMLLKTMNPQWIAVDEITSPDDICAMEEIAYCGVRLLATAHGMSVDDLYNRPLYRKIIDKKIFKQVFLLSSDKSYTMEELAQ